MQYPSVQEDRMVFASLANPQILEVLFVLLAVVVAIALVTLLWSHLKGKPEEFVVNASEWQPTSRIDFHCVNSLRDDKAPAAFLLRVEHYRTVEGVSGVKRTEIRWRNATLEEAKLIVVLYQKATATETGVPQIPRLLASDARRAREAMESGADFAIAAE
jgi:hypothetical protein